MTWIRRILQNLKLIRMKEMSEIVTPILSESQKEAEQAFNGAGPEVQWGSIIEFSDNVILILDNDQTHVIFKQDDEELNVYLKNHIGNSPGIEDLLNVLGIKYEHV